MGAGAIPGSARSHKSTSINFRDTKPNIAKQTVQKPERKFISKKNKNKISKSLPFEPSSILQFNQITLSFQCRNVNDKTAVVLLLVSFKCFKQNYLKSFPPFH